MTFVVAGARARIREPEAVVEDARRWGSDHDRDVLLADARGVFGRDHLISAASHAERAKLADRMISRSVSLEALLYLSGRRQVADAIRTLGIRADTASVAIALFGGPEVEAFLRTMGWEHDETTLDPGGKSLRALGITALAERTVPTGSRADLALEKVALVDVVK